VNTDIRSKAVADKRRNPTVNYKQMSVNQATVDRCCFTVNTAYLSKLNTVDSVKADYAKNNANNCYF